MVPRAAVLVAQQHELPVGVESCRGAGFVQPDECQEPEDLRLSGHQSRPARRPAIPRPRPAAAEWVLLGGGGQVALVEQQVDDGEDLVEPFGQLGLGGDAVRDPGVGDLPFGAGDALRDGGLRDEERGGDLGGGQPAHGAQGQGDLGLPGQGRVAAGEDQPESVVGLGRDRPLQLGELVAVAGLAAQHVQAAAAGDGEQPRVGAVGDALDRPALQRGLDGVLHEVLGGGEVAEQVHQGRGEPARVLAHHAGQLVVRPRRHRPSV